MADKGGITRCARPCGRYPTHHKGTRRSSAPGRRNAGTEVWRTEWDSNPRTPVKMLLDFQSSAFDRSAICPTNQAVTLTSLSAIEHTAARGGRGADHTRSGL